MKNLIFIGGIILILSSCDPDMIYDKYQGTEKGEWKWADKKVFKVHISDSLSSYNILINIRHTTEYPKSNLFVFITTTAPNGQFMRDTVEIKIANDRGKWFGNGFGHIKLISRIYRKGVKFKYAGEYTFSIEQGMRLPEIPVTDVGLRIENFIMIQ
jgi:gliding motility-associated lipoprotein GldH